MEQTNEALDQIEFDSLSDENEELEPTDYKRTVFTDQGDPEVESLYGKYKRGKLVVQEIKGHPLFY